jgi:transposase-like protein
MSRIAVDVPALFAAWSDHALTVTEVARECGVTTDQLYVLARQHKLPPRPKQQRCFSFDDADTEDEEEASGDSLDLAPEVQRRILELGIGYPNRARVAS